MTNISTVLVTGGAGFIGSHLCEELIAQNINVICLDNFDPFYDPRIKRKNIAHLTDNEGFILVEGDIRDADLLAEIKRKHAFDAVVHLAARAGVRRAVEEPISYEETNVKGTMILLESLKDYPIQNLVFSSSSSIYGIIERSPTAETDDTSRPISPYSATKKAGELLCYAYHHIYSIPVTCVRLFSVYGPRVRPDLVIHKFARLIESGQELPILGDGTAKRDLTYVGDIVSGIISALKKPMGFEIFNLGNSQPVELLKVIRLLEENLGMPAKLKFYPPHPSDVPVTYADISKARRELGYLPKTDIATGIKKFAEWFLERDQ